MTRPIPFNAQITFPIYVASQLLHMGGKKYLMAAIPVVLMSRSVFSSPNPASIKALIPALTCLLTVPIVLLAIRLRWKRIYSQTPYFQYPFSGEVSSSGLTFSSQRGTGTIPWEDFTGYKANEKLMIIYQGPIMFHIFRMEFFSSPEDWSSAIEQVRTAKMGPS